MSCGPILFESLSNRLQVGDVPLQQLGLGEDVLA